MSPALAEELTAAYRRDWRGEGVRAILLAGAGKHFCAGADLENLRRLADASPLDNRLDSRRLRDLFDAILRQEALTVALVQGSCVAGGCGLATACDFVVAAEDARFLYSEVRIGFVAALVATYLPLRLRGSDIRELLLAPEFVPAARALEIGLVNRVVPAGGARRGGRGAGGRSADPGLVGVDRAHQAVAPGDRRPAARRAARRSRPRPTRTRARPPTAAAAWPSSSPPRARPAGATESRRAVRLILFDLDGTLLDCGGQAKPIFAEALVEVFGETGDVDGYDFSGRTDPRIVLDLMTGAATGAGRGSRARPGGA